jgi:protein SCO1/2
MRIAIVLLAGLASCWGDNAYIVEGTVVEVNAPHEVVVAHEEIKGLMGAMTMPFQVHDPGLIAALEPGDRITARLMLEQDGSYLSRIRVTGKGPVPAPMDMGVAPLRPGQVLPATPLVAEDGSALVVGEGQGIGTAVAFLYTRCPLPEFCPALVARFQALQEQVGTDARLVAVTIDPEHDTREVLAAFASNVGARPETWRFARAEGGAQGDLAARAALSVSRDTGEIVHSSRLLVLDREGRLVERYDDNRWSLDRVAEQLRTGAPPAPAGSDGTVTPEPGK